MHVCVCVCVCVGGMPMDGFDRHREEKSCTGYEWLEKHLRKEIVIITEYMGGRRASEC